MRIPKTMAIGFVVALAGATVALAQTPTPTPASTITSTTTAPAPAMTTNPAVDAQAGIRRIQQRQAAIRAMQERIRMQNSALKTPQTNAAASPGIAASPGSPTPGIAASVSPTPTPAAPQGAGN